MGSEMSNHKLKDEIVSAMRNDFVHGYINDEGVRVFPLAKELSERYGVAQSTLYKYIEKRDWQSEKNRVQTEIELKNDSERMERLTKSGKKFDDKSLTAAERMMAKVNRRLSIGFKLEEDEPNSFGIPTAELKELSIIAINAQKLAKLALGQAQEISKVSADISSPDAFREVLEQLDEIAESRSSRHDHTLQ